MTSGEPGTPATVTNRGTGANAVLDFVIPKGDAGTSGTSGLTAYGGKYNNTAQTIVLNVGTQTVLPLPLSMPMNNVNSTANGLAIQESGVYEIKYMLSTSPSLGAAITLAVRRNGSVIPSTEERHLLAAVTDSVFSGSVIADLSAGDVVDMAVSAATTLTLSLSSGVTVTLSVKKLNS